MYSLITRSVFMAVNHSHLIPKGRSNAKNNEKRNWSAYNDSLVKRGDVFLWFDEATLANWYSESDRYKRGRPYIYSNVAMQALLSIREVFHLTFRSLVGFGQSLFPC